jgi:hypothetical protein
LGSRRTTVGHGAPVRHRGAAIAIVLAIAALVGLLASRGNAGVPQEIDNAAVGASSPDARPAPGSPDPVSGGTPQRSEAIRWRASTSLGLPWSGRLVNGVQLPPEGELFYTWDPIKDRSPNRGWRRWGSDRLVALTLHVLADFKADHPDAPRIGIGDLSRPGGGDFGARFGRPGHASHQNGRDIDIYYPRRDGREREAWRPPQVDRRLSQDLVDRFVAAGVQFVFVGYNVGLRGPRKVVQKLPRHDNHLHVRIPRLASR